MYDKRTFILNIVILTLMMVFLWYPAHAETQTVKSADGVPIAYQVKGKGDLALVFVHCWSCNKGYWDGQVPYFSDKYKVVTIDLAGHGESGSDRKEWTHPAFGQDVAAVVKKLQLKQVILIGHSMGGPIIAEAARLIPKQVIGLIGVDTFRNVERTFTKERIEQFMAAIKKDFAGTTRTIMMTVMFTPKTDPALKEKIISDMTSAPAEIAIAALKANYEQNLPVVLDEIKVPVHCINSSKFPTDVDGLKRHTVSSEIKYMVDVGHYLYLEDPKTFNQLLEETIKKLLKH